MSLRDKVKDDPGFLDQPLRVLDAFERLGREKLTVLLTALSNNDEKAAAAVFGASPEQMERAFKELKMQAQKIAEVYPDILDPTKGF